MNISGSISQFLKGRTNFELLRTLFYHNSDVMPIESIIGVAINDPNGNKIGTITSIDPENDLWYGTMDYDIFKEEHTASIEIDTAAVKYKEELIQQLKLLGQEVIDRAEDLVGNNDLRTSLEIKLSFSQESVPTLKCTSEHLSKRYFDYLENHVKSRKE